jgi:arylsulfatase A-like enzyme
VLDIVPTLCAALKVDAGKLCEGQDIAPLLAGGAVPARDLFWSDGKNWAVRSGDLKLISGGGRMELFDLAADPAETSNRAGERQPEVVRLRATYERLAKAP